MSTALHVTPRSLFAAIVAILLGSRCGADTAPICDEPPGQDVYWVVDYYFTYDNLWGGGVVADPVHLEGFELDWDDSFLWGDPGGTFRKGATKGSAASGSVVCNSSSQTHRVAQHSTWFGSGAITNVQVFIKGPPGTPFYVLRSFSGAIEATKSPDDGEGSVNQTFNGQTVWGDGGMSVDSWLPVLRGTTSNTTKTVMVDGQPVQYSRAHVDSISLGGLVVQGYCACCGCPPLVTTLDANGAITMTIDAGKGALPCGGRLLAPVNVGPCEAWDTGVQRRFEVKAFFDDDCGCCEYRQFARTRHVVTRTGVGSWAYAMKGGRNCEDRRMDGDCLVEDCFEASGLVCGFLTVHNGHRDDNPTLHDWCRTPNIDLYGASNDERTTACSYAGFDTPTIDNLAPGTHYTMAMDFEGQIIVNGDCFGSGHVDQVIARRRWTIECEGVTPGGQGGGDIAGGKALDPPYVFTLDGFSVDGSPRPMHISLSRQGAVLLGSAMLQTGAEETLTYGQLAIEIGGLNELLQSPSEQPLTVLTSLGDARTSFRDFAFVWSGQPPRVVSLTVTFGGVSQTRQIAVGPDGAGLLGDLSGDGVIDGDDLGQLLAALGPCPPRPTDIDEDGVVGPGDLGLLLAAWGANGGPADVDGDGIVSGGDLGALVADWGAPPICDDLDGDGMIDAADLGILLAGWNG